MTGLVLGTAQFGTGYGVTNSVGRLTDEAVSAIVARAVKGGIHLFDTAAGYDDAQSRLGSALVGRKAGVVTKFALPVVGEQIDAGSLVAGSLRSLGVDRLYGLLLHRVDDLRDPRWGEALVAVRSARESGMVERIGVSIYDASDLELAVSAFPDLDLLQIPGSVVDRRLLDSPLLADLHAAGVEVHVRSLFLQGLLLAEPSEVDARFTALVPHLTRLRAVAAEAGITVAELVVQQVRDHPMADSLVVGATSVAELDEILVAFHGAERERLEAPSLPVELVDPRRW